MCRIDRSDRLVKLLGVLYVRFIDSNATEFTDDVWL